MLTREQITERLTSLPNHARQMVEGTSLQVQREREALETAQELGNALHFRVKCGDPSGYSVQQSKCRACGDINWCAWLRGEGE